MFTVGTGVKHLGVTAKPLLSYGLWVYSLFGTQNVPTRGFLQMCAFTCASPVAWHVLYAGHAFDLYFVQNHRHQLISLSG